MNTIRFHLSSWLALTALAAAPVSGQSASVAARAASASSATVADMASLGAVAGVHVFRGVEGLRGLAAIHVGALSGLSGLHQLEGVDAGDVIVFGRSRDRFDVDQVSDSLYRLARQSLNRGDFRRASELFQQVRSRDPRAPIAADALYWHAYANYRAGGSTGLETALASLTTLRSEYPRASINGDARDLRVRVCGELARQGNERCAVEIENTARGRGSSGGASVTSQDQQGCPDENDDERVAALNALLQMDAERALPLLEKTLARRDRCSVTLRRKAIFLISQKRNARSADLLLNAIRNDPDGEVREQAVFWLGQTRDERAIGMLEDILRSEKDEGVLDKAIFALSQQRSPRAAATLRDIAVRENAPTKLREQAIFWLGQQKSEENADLLINLYGRVTSDDVRDKIIFSLSQMRSQKTDKFMMDLALDERSDVEMRKKALFWAGQNKSVDVAALAGIYDRVSNQEMREQVIFVLAQRRDAVAVDKLFDIAKNDRDREMRKKALFWLGQSRDPRVLKLLEDILNK